MNIIILLFVYLVISNFNCIVKKIIKEKTNNIKILSRNYIECLENIDNDIIFDLNSIKEYNKKIKSKSDKIYNLNIEKLSKNEIISYIQSYNIPKKTMYNDGKKINFKDIEWILENRNLNKIKEEVILNKGIVVERSNLRSFPTNIHFYDNQSVNNFDRIQETEIHVNTLALIIHQSKDKKWVFVITEKYYGWIEEKNIAYASKDDIDYFINYPSFGIITTPFLKIENTYLDMSVKLPYQKETRSSYELVLPTKDKNNKIKRKNIIIEKSSVNIGYLPYTKRNVYVLAFKYLNIPYSWGGLSFGIDCSGLISNIYQTFGFIFPRNTKDQCQAFENYINLQNKGSYEKLKIIQNSEPSLLYKDGHVLIYLGNKNNKYYVISASGSIKNMKVIIEELNDYTYLKNINKVFLIE